LGLPQKPSPKPSKLALLGGSGKVFMQIMYWANGFLIFGLLAEEDPSM